MDQVSQEELKRCAEITNQWPHYFRQEIDYSQTLVSVTFGVVLLAIVFAIFGLSRHTAWGTLSENHPHATSNLVS